MSACATGVDDSPVPTGRDSAAVSTSPSLHPSGEYQDVPAAWSAVIDPKAIPLGDDKIVTTPTIGSLYSCKTVFGGRGAPHSGPWIDTVNKTWDSTAKVQVSGSHTWPQANYRESVQDDVRKVESDDLPTKQITGTFPIAPDDPAYQYDRNPNGIAEKVVDLSLPLNPAAAGKPGCVGMGAVGVLKNGVFIYNAVDAAGGDAAAHETQDACDGHPDGTEAYHYHAIPSCLLSAASSKGSTLVGYALDGYGIYIERDADGSLPTDADLDACHGRTSTVRWNGKSQQIYHYDATMEFPYTISCYHGTPVTPPTRG